jgi:lipoprotein NlpD
MKTNIIAAIMISVLLVACSNNRDETPAEVIKVQRKTPYHIVSEEDTVGSIALKYNMTRVNLIKLNNLKPPYDLYPGQRLIIKIDNELNDNHQTPSEDSILKKEPESEHEPESESNEETVSTEAKEDMLVKPEYIWPIANGREKIAQHFEANKGGITINASVGTDVKAIADGKVVVAGVPNGEAAAYGITAVIRHKDKMSVYSHLKEVKVEKGDTVKQGDVIGIVGNRSSAQKPQLYFEMRDIIKSKGGNRKKNHPIDPENILP